MKFKKGDIIKHKATGTKVYVYRAVLDGEYGFFFKSKMQPYYELSFDDGVYARSINYVDEVYELA